MHPSRDGRSGYSVVELAVLLAVAGTLLAAAAPSFMSMVHDERMTTQINLLLSDVNLARLEAIKRNQDVVLCRSAHGARCARSSGARADWSGGWIVYVNSDGDKKRGASEPLLTARPALPEGMTLHFNQWWRVIYHGNGGARNGAFTLCDSRGAGHARTLILYYTGRPRISDKQSDGDPLDCT